MKGKKYIGLAVGLMGLMTVCGCQSADIVQDGTDGSTWDVPVSFVVQSARLSSATTGSGSGENPTYDNPRTLYTDHILLNVYKRQKDGSYADDAAGFTFDRQVGLTCREPDAADPYYSDHFRYAYASGTIINMDRNYEYRCTALGYAEQKGEQNLFSFTGSTFSDAQVCLTNFTQYTTPELFFGTPRYGADMTDKETGTVVFSYQSGAINALGGWLYRCVAGTSLTLRKVPPEVKALTLLTSAVNTQCQSRYYDDYVTPIADGKKVAADVEAGSQFVMDAWTRPDNWIAAYGVSTAKDSVNVTMNESNLLPVTSTLYVRITIEKEGADDEVMVVPLRMKRRTTSSCSTTDTINTDEQLANGTLVFQRNHYYEITGEYEALVIKKLPLVVYVNPNWDGDIDLILDK